MPPGREQIRQHHDFRGAGFRQFVDAGGDAGRRHFEEGVFDQVERCIRLAQPRGEAADFIVG